jgi:hypothetical protein
VRATVKTSDSLTPLDRARDAAEPFVARLASKPEVEGIVFLSSAARSGDRATFDLQSDLDMTVFVRIGMTSADWRSDVREVRRNLADRIPRWMPDFSFYIPVPTGPVEVNLHQRIFDYEADERTVWDEAMREAHAYTAEIVYDRHGEVARLIADKTARDQTADRDRIIRLASRLSWDIRILPQRQLERGDAAAAHLMLNQAVDEIIELLHVLGGRYLPHRKWRMYNLTAHNLASEEEVRLLQQGLVCGELTGHAFHRRLDALEELYASIRTRFPDNIPEDVYEYYSANISVNRQLLTDTVATMAAERWGAIQGVRDLANYLVLDDPADMTGFQDRWPGDLPDCWHDVVARLRDSMAGDQRERPPHQPGE